MGGLFQNISFADGNMNAVSGITYDVDALLFITATGISGTNASAINQLVLDLKAASIWTKMKALYPFVGGTATSHKFNLKNPLDTDAAFRLLFNGGMTHDINGITGNGSNTFADTRLTPSLNLLLNDSHISIYCRTNNAAEYMDMGANDNPSVVTNTSAFQLRWSDGNMYSRVHNPTTTATSNTNSQGFYVASRLSSTSYKLYKNNLNYNFNIASTARSGRTIYIGAWNNQGGTFYYTNRNYAFASIGDGLTDTEAANFYTAVQVFNTTLGRQV
jgi:hypothetical protein